MQLYAYEGTANVHLQFIDGLPAPRYIMSFILSSIYQHCDEQQFQTLSCALYTMFPAINLDLVVQALLLDYILALKKYAYTLRASCFYIKINNFEHVEDKIYKTKY